MLLERVPSRQVASEASLESAADHVLFPGKYLRKSQAPLMVCRGQERVKEYNRLRPARTPFLPTPGNTLWPRVIPVEMPENP